MDTTLSPPDGQLLDGRYRVESRLAQGGMATVYLGRDTRLDRVVALKIAHQDLAADTEFIRRFMTEARAVAQLSSPNVVGVFDQGSVPGPTGDLSYIVMEYVAGPTLREVLRNRGRLTVRESLDVIEGVLAGLAAAHRAGIIHRDVKPENVLLGRDGAVKVADFGLARAAVAAASTKTGMIIGTAAYLAPEQVARSMSDARTDVYAAGVMLFEMLTGQQPHTGDSPLEVAYKHVNESVPAPSSRAPGLSPALDALVAMATSRDPDLRPPDAGAFLQAVSELRRGGAPAPGRHGLHAPPADTQAMNGPVTGEHEAAGYAPAGYAPAGYDAGGYAGGGSYDDTDLGPAIAAGAGRPGGPDSHPYGRPDHASPADNATAAFGPGVFGQGGYGPGSFPGGLRGPDSGSANHTMVVSPGEIVPGFDDPGYDGGRGGYRRGRYHGDGEPLLQRLMFSRRLIWVLGGAAAVLAVVLLAWWLTAGQDTRVPDVTNFSAPLARTELSGLGLKVRTGAPRHSNVPAGHIVATSPKAGAEITNGGTITLFPSLGPVKIAVPSVTGEPVSQAISTLKQAGLRVSGPVQAPSDTIPAGIVVRTSPAGGTDWPQDRPVTVFVSAGPPLPNFTGAPLASAQAAAQQGGYQISPVTAASGNQPAGTIISQSPAPGTPIQQGEVVTVNVSPGPPMVEVPDVQGQTVQQAEQELQAAGFQVSVQPGFGPGDRVQDFNPTGTAPKGSTITLSVGFGF
jgi:beta-lactam-binding protein with PASTA domain